MHGQHCEKRQQQWHMWPGPSRRPVHGTVTDSAGVDSFSKAGRKIGVGDCALFQAGNAPPFVGIIRKLTTEKEGNLKLGVNWLYRPGDIKLGKGVSLEAAPNEIFYSFHKDEISAASLLHPCKVAFLRKGAELPSRVSSFVCRRVYDIANKCLYWLTDQDYTDERQEEVDQLLDRTKFEMQTVVQTGVSSQRALSGPTSSQKGDIVNAGFPGQGKSKKRERTDQSLDSCKREKSMKLEDYDSGHCKRECSVKFEEITNIMDRDGGIANMPGVDQLVQVMFQERNDSLKKPGDLASRRTLLASMIAATEREDCLTRFVQLGGLPVLDEWLQEAHKGKVGDGGSPKEGDKGLEELLLTLLRALEKLPVDLDALKTYKVGKSVNLLRGHKNLEIQKKARKLVDTWKKRVDAEMKSSGESKSGSNTGTAWSSKQPSIETYGTKVRSVTEGGGVKGSAGVKASLNGSGPGDVKCNVVPISGCKEHPGLSTSTILKDNPVKSHTSGTSEALLATVKEERSSSSSQSQNNSQSWGSGSGKGAGSWKEEVKTSSAVSTGTKTTAILRSHSHSGKGHPTASSTGSQKESVSGKQSVWNKASGNEKAANPAVIEKGTAESVRAENSNNQRIIVKLPNPGRSPACSASGGSLADGGAPASRGSSPGSSERVDSVDGKSKSLSTVPAVHSPATSGDTKSGNCNGNAGKSGVDCGEEKERSCIATADDVDCKSSDAEHRPKEAESCFNYSNLYAGKGLPDGVQVGVVKKGISASLAAPSSSDTSPETHGLDTSEGGIDLLASVAAGEGSETEKSFSGITGEEQASCAQDDLKDSLIKARHSHESEFLDGVLVASHENDEKRKNDVLAKLSTKSLMDSGVTSEKVDPGSLIVQETRGSADHSEGRPGVSTEEQRPEERARDGASDSILACIDSSVAKDMTLALVRGTEAFPCSQDGCSRTKVVRRETVLEEKGTISRLPTDICNGSSLAGENQRTASGSDVVCLVEEGLEDSKKVSTSSPSALMMRVSAKGQAAKDGDTGLAYYEEDALEVARQVAKEVEQEVEQYGKPEPQDITSNIPNKVEVSQESPGQDTAKNHWVSVGEADARVKGHDGDECHADATVQSDDSQETVTDKREELEMDRIPPSREGEEVDQVSCSHSSPEKLRPAAELGLGSVVDDIKEVKEVAIVEEASQSLPVAGQDEPVDTSVSNIQATELPVPDQEAALTHVSNGRNCGSSDISGRPVFDLNEGFVAEEVPHDDAMPLAVPSLNPAGIVPDSPACSLAAPIAVVAATKGAFIPPSNLSRSKGELRWKGSAATSAFRPAEPRRTTETLQSHSDTTGTGTAAEGSGQSGKRAWILDIDLNVADDRVTEDAFLISQNAVTSLGSGCQLPLGSTNESSSSGVPVNSTSVAVRPELDLNRVDESDESLVSLMSDSRGADGPMQNTAHVSLAATRSMRDFDLNDGPGLEESMGEEPPLQHSNGKALENSALPVLSGLRSTPDFVNLASWYPAANPLHTMVMPAFSASRTDSSYPVITAPNAKSIISMSHNLGSFNGDLYRAGAVMSSSPAVSYATTTMPAGFPYAGFPFGSSFPFPSASYNVSSAPYVTSTSSPPFPTAPSQLVSAGYGRPYLMGITEVPVAETDGSWSRPSLDLNAGPDAVDVDAREEGSTRQIPPLGQLSFQQAGSSGGSLKRKEPEGGFDPFRSGFKQMTWR